MTAPTPQHADARVMSRHTDGAIALLRELNGGHEPYAPAVGFVQRWLANWEAEALAAERACSDALAEALESVRDYFDQRADADAQGDPLRYVGNAEMHELGAIDRALARYDVLRRGEMEAGDAARE